MSTSAVTRLRRPLAATVAAGVGAAGLTLLPAPAAHAEPAPIAFQWEISQQFDDHLGVHTLTEGATESEDGVVTFPDGEGTFDPATGETEVAYQGSVEGAFQNSGSTYYRVTLADPTVSVDAEGNGAISAVVSAWNAPLGGPEAATDPTRVVVTTFQAGVDDWTSVEGVASLTATPHWLGVLPEGEESVALGIGAGKPVDGASFAPSFLGQLTPGVRAHFYRSADGQPAKTPSPFTLTAPEPAVDAPAVTYTAKQSTKGVDLTVSGTGFNPETNPGDMGVYVGLAPRGGLPDVSEITDQDAFAAASWVMPAQFDEGAFTTALSAARAKLDPRKRYSLYTWQAHTHSNTTQDTETPVAIDWGRLGFPLKSTTKVTVNAKPTTKKAGKATVTVTGAHVTPFGKVAVTLKKGKATRKVTGTLKRGKAVVKLPKSAKGPWKLTAQYAKNAVYKASSKQVKVTVTK